MRDSELFGCPGARGGSGDDGTDVVVVDSVAWQVHEGGYGVRIEFTDTIPETHTLEAGHDETQDELRSVSSTQGGKVENTAEIHAQREKKTGSRGSTP